MSIRILLIAVACAICLCAADVSQINQQPVLPFNDLLPPLEEDPTTQADPNPTKESYYQQQARSKAVLSSDETPAATPTLQPDMQLSVDLLPPFAEPTSNHIEIGAVSTTRPPVVATFVSSAALPPVQQQARVSRPNSIPSSDSTYLSAELISQYATHFQFTTPRPPSRPLPTLTPFPRFIKN
ncbi:uncharacterized protein LOC108602559 [Drosophila busckii]|uniref:uncharacterized protein LOC108602559 n=1 Tax=Drosophila busckii TaxID=30019 RepID=UPI00083EC207|nr:uncharacterized protein LOC108602559 [Drosophila busckii]